MNNPKNDADDIASILNKLNFDVTKIMDANLIDIQKSVNDFLQALDEYAVGVFFYAGHGMQIDGKNFIVPIDVYKRQCLFTSINIVYYPVFKK